MTISEALLKGEKHILEATLAKLAHILDATSADSPREAASIALQIRQIAERLADIEPSNDVDAEKARATLETLRSNRRGK